ncbi:spore coat protein U domain-containing protein [Thermomonas sp.]
MLALASALPAKAVDAASVPVSATVLSKSNCKFRGAKSVVLAFGNIDPASATAATASTGLVIRCAGSAGLASYALTLDDGLYGTGPGALRMKHASLNAFLPYSVSLNPASGNVAKNVDLDITVSGSVTPTDFQDAMIGVYADTLVITLNP